MRKEFEEIQYRVWIRHNIVDLIAEYEGCSRTGIILTGSASVSMKDLWKKRKKDQVQINSVELTFNRLISF